MNKSKALSLVGKSKVLLPKSKRTYFILQNNNATEPIERVGSKQVKSQSTTIVKYILSCYDIVSYITAVVQQFVKNIINEPIITGKTESLLIVIRKNINLFYIHRCTLLFSKSSIWQVQKRTAVLMPKNLFMCYTSFSEYHFEISTNAKNISNK